MNDEIKREKEKNKIIILLENNRMKKDIENMAKESKAMKRLMTIIKRNESVIDLPKKTETPIIDTSTAKVVDTPMVGGEVSPSQMDEFIFVHRPITIEDKLIELHKLMEKIKKVEKLCPDCITDEVKVLE